MTQPEGPVLVTLDGSQIAELAIGPALQLARLWKAPVHFVHVVESEKSTIAQSWTEEPLKHFEAYLGGLLKRENAPPVDWRASLRFGSAASTILQLSQGASLIVIATHGRGDFHASFIGSVTDKVVRGSAVPVLTVPVEGNRDLHAGPILVPLDGSASAEIALEPARDLASKLGTGVALIRSYSWPLFMAPEFASSGFVSVELLQQSAEEYLAATALAGEQKFAVLGRPATAIEDVAQQLNSSVIAMTTRGHGMAGRLALGSTTDRVLHSVRRLILVVPPPEPREG